MPQSNASHPLLTREHARRIGEVFMRAALDMFEDSAPQWAAAIAYYSLLSIFPLLLAIVAVAAFFIGDKATVVNEATQLAGSFVPDSSNLVQQVVGDAFAARGSIGVLSLGSLLWSGSRVFGAITKGLNIAYDVDETYGFWKRTLIELIMVLTIGMVFVIALALPFVIDMLRALSRLVPAREEDVLWVARFVGQAVLLLGAFLLTYRFVPRGKQRWRAALSGSVVATVLVLLARPIFFRYVESIGQYNLTYGSIALVIVFVLWIWVVALILLFGGEIASHVQAMLIEGQSSQEVERRHQKRSPTRKKT